MARTLIRAHIVNAAGDAQASKSINIYKSGTTTAVTDTLYTTRTGSTTLTNPVTTDSNGDVVAWANLPGTDLPYVRFYNLTIGVDQEDMLIPMGPGAVTALTSTITVSADTTDTTAITYTIPANQVVAGSFYRLRIYGDNDCPSDASPTNFPIKLKLGGTTLVTTNIAVPTSSARTNQAFEAELIMTVRSIATPTAATVIAQARSLNELTGTLAGALDLVANTSTTTFDSTAATALTATIACGEATAGYVIRAYHATIEVVVP